MTCSKSRHAAFLVAGVGLFACVTQVQASDIEDLIKSPQKYLGQQVEMKAYCTKGGRSGDVLGYECTTDDGVYLDTDDITPDDAKDKFANDCAGGKCEATVTFEPHSYSVSGVIEPDRDVVIFNAKSAKVSF